MADKIYNPPPAPPEHATCPRCSLDVVPHQAGGVRGDATTWKYACQGTRRAWRVRVAGEKGAWKHKRTCGYTVSLPVVPNPAALPGLAKELRSLAGDHDDAKRALRLAAELLDPVPEGLPAALPPGEIPADLRRDLAELANHACAAGLAGPTRLLRALARRGISPVTAKVMEGFRPRE